MYHHTPTKICNVVGRPLNSEMTKMYQKLKEKIFYYRKFKKPVALSRAAFQDRRIEELALAGNTEASAVRLI